MSTSIWYIRHFDIYEVFCEMAHVCQTVNLLPHERYDITMGVVDNLQNLANCMWYEICRYDPDNMSDLFIIMVPSP